MGDAVSITGFKSAVRIVTFRDLNHPPTELKNAISFYPSITKTMVKSICEILWVNNSGTDLGSHPISYYGSASDDDEKKSSIAQQRIRYNTLSLCINNSITADVKCKLRAYNTPYNYYYKYFGATMFCVVVKCCALTHVKDDQISRVI